MNKGTGRGERKGKNPERVRIIRRSGIFLEPPIAAVERELRDVNSGKCYVAALNGRELYVKENGVVRKSTQVEWEKFHRGRRVL